MRGFIAFLIGLMTAAFIAATGVIVTQNNQGEQVTFLGLTFQGYVGWDLAAAAGLGFILAFLLLIPGRLASAWRLGGLSRQARALEQKLAALRQEHAKLEGQHDLLREEHAELRTAAMSVPLASAALAARESLDPTGMAAMPTSFVEPEGRVKPPIFLPRIQLNPPESAEESATWAAQAGAATTRPAPRASLRERLGARVAAGRAWAYARFEVVQVWVRARFRRREDTKKGGDGAIQGPEAM